MQVIRISSSNNIMPKLPSLVATIGQFDGLHLGHMQLINKCLEIKKAKNLSSAVVTFYPRVATILKNDSHHNYLLSFDDFSSILNNLGIDYLITIEFSEVFSKLSHRDFIQKIIMPLNIQDVVVGFDFCYGYLGLGNISTISKDSNDLIKISVIDEYKINNQKVGTHQIKQLLKEGNIELTNKLLGYPFFLNMNLHNGELTCDNLSLLKEKEYLVSINNHEFLITIKNHKIIFNAELLNSNVIVKFLK